jgi:hypothetical protein
MNQGNQSSANVLVENFADDSVDIEKASRDDPS